MIWFIPTRRRTGYGFAIVWSVLAYIYMKYFEEIALGSTSLKQSMWLRYCNKKGGWTVCLLSNRKKRVSRTWIRGINFSLIKGEQPNFFDEKYPFFLQQPSNPNPYPSSSLVLHSKTRISRAFRQNLNHYTKTPHPDPSYNVVIYMRFSM